MPSFEIRLTRCPQCNDTFTYKYRLPEDPDADLQIPMTCLSCKTKLLVDLSKYCRKQIISYKGEKPATPKPITFDLPAEIPAVKREAKNGEKKKK